MAGNSVFFPLRGNIAFFEQKADQPALVARIKQSLLMYDDLVFEDGGYELSCNDSGILEMHIPPGKVHAHRSVPDKPMTSFQAVATNELTGESFTIIPHSGIARCYYVNFRSILADLRLDNQPFISFLPLALNENGKIALAAQLTASEKYFETVEGNIFFKKYVVQNALCSLMYAEDLHLPMMVDNIHRRLFAAMSQDLALSADLRIEVLRRVNNLLQFTLPDFSDLSVEELLVLRNDDLFKEFRKKLLELNDRLQSDLSRQDPNQIEPLFTRELLEAIAELAPNDKKIIIHSLVGAASSVPGLGLAITGGTMIKDGADLYNFKNSWLTFMLSYQK